MVSLASPTGGDVTRVLLWTRDPGARDTIPLVLSRIDQPFVRCDSLAGILKEMSSEVGPVMLVLGPTFDEKEAREVRSALVESTGRRVTVVLLEDVLDPLPPRLVLTRDEVRLRLPVRPRTLREVVDAWRGSRASSHAQSRPPGSDRA